MLFILGHILNLQNLFIFGWRKYIFFWKGELNYINWTWLQELRMRHAGRNAISSNNNIKKLSPTKAQLTSYLISTSVAFGDSEILEMLEDFLCFLDETAYNRMVSARVLQSTYRREEVWGNLRDYLHI